MLLADDGRARLHDAGDLRPLGPMFLLDDPRISEDINPAEFSPDGRLLLVHNRGDVLRLWDPTQGTPVGPAMEHPASLFAKGFVPDGGRIAVATGDGFSGAWDVTSAAGPAGAAARDTPAVDRVQRRRDRLATASEDGTVRA